jgi:hypothetical protein
MAYSSNQFSYHKESNSLTAEASDLRLRGWPAMIQIRSERTGRVISCLKKDCVTDAGSEDILAFHYMPIADNNGPVKLSCVTIFND